MKGQFAYFFLGLSLLVIVWFFMYENRGINKKQGLIISGIMSIQLLLGVFTADQHINYLIYMTLLVYSLCSLNYTRSFFHLSFCLSSFYIIEIIAYSITVGPINILTAFNGIENDHKHALTLAAYALLPFATLFILFLVNNIIQKFKILPYLLENDQKHYLFLLAYSSGFLFFTLIRQQTGYPRLSRDHYYATGFLFLYYIFYFYYLAYNALKKHRLEETIAIEELLNQEKEAIQKKEAFNHDYKNILGTLNILLDEARFSEAQELLNEITEYSSEYIGQEGMEQLSNIRVSSFRAVVKESFLKSRQKDVPYQLFVPNKIREIYIPPVELIRVFSILYTNAIEAASESSKPLLIIEILAKEKELQIRIKNTYDRTPDLEQLFAKNYTTKIDHKGIGLHNLAKIVSKYENIQLHASNDENNRLLCIQLLITG